MRPLLISFAAAALALSLSAGLLRAGSWQWQNPTPHGEDLFAVWARSATDIFAAGSAFMHYDGSRWIDEGLDPYWIPLDMWGVPTGEVYAVGYNGLALVHDGIQWTQIPTGLSDHLYSVWAHAANDVYAAGSSSRMIYHYDGSSWTHLATAPDGIHDLWGSGPDDIYAVGFYGMVYHFDGSTWSLISGLPEIDATGVIGFGPGEVYVLLLASQLYHYDGTGWNFVTATSDGSWQGRVWGTGADDLHIVNSRGILARFDGATLTESIVPHRSYGALAGLDGLVIASGEAGSLAIFNGSFWQQQTQSLNSDFVYGVWSPGPADAFAVTGQGRVLRYDGTVWSEFYSTPTSTILFDVWGFGSEDVFVVGNQGIRHFDGSSWTLMDDGIAWHSSFNAVWGLAPDDVYAVGAFGAVVHYDGVTWTEQAAVTSGELFGIWGSEPNDIWAVGPENEILHFDGIQWQALPVTTPSAMADVWGSGPDDVYAVGRAGALHYDGSAWALLDVGLSRRMDSVWGSSSEDVHVAAAGGMIYFDGSTWSQPPIADNRQLLGVGGSSATNVFAVGHAGTILHYGPAVTATAPAVAAGAELRQNEPNPFNPSTRISFELDFESHVTLAVYDVAGRRIQTLLDRWVFPGETTVSWDGRDDHGRSVSSGVYLYRLRTDAGLLTRKMSLVK